MTSKLKKELQRLFKLPPDQLLAEVNAELDRAEIQIASRPKVVILCCLKCHKPLPPEQAGLCRDCSLLGKEAPYCPKCKVALPYDPKGKMAQFNPRCKCKSKKR